MPVNPPSRHEPEAMMPQADVVEERPRPVVPQPGTEPEQSKNINPTNKPTSSVQGIKAMAESTYQQPEEPSRVAESSRSTDMSEEAGRIKGRNTGRFRKGLSGQQPAVYGAQPPPGMGETDLTPPRKTTSTAGLMQDMFVESATRPSRPSSAAASRRNSVGSANSAENLADAAYSQELRRPMRKSTSNLGRTESYKQARGGGYEEDAAAPNLARVGPQRNAKAYGSMPRLQGQRGRVMQTGGDPGMPPRPHSRGGTRNEHDPCKVM